MATMKVAKSAARNISELTLKHAPLRVMAFLNAVTANTAIRSTLAAKAKLTNARIDEGWALLVGLRTLSDGAALPENPAAIAVADCELWQSTGGVRVRAILELTYPDQAAFVFHGSVPGKGVAAVFNVETFVERCEELAHSPERKATRKEDAQALQVIAEIGITKETLHELRAMVKAARSAPASVTTDPADIEAARQEQYLEVLRQLHAWVTTWAEMARTVIKNRNQLVQLGIAKRRPRTTAAVVTPPVATAPAAPTAPVPAPAANDNGPDSRAA